MIRAPASVPQREKSDERSQATHRAGAHPPPHPSDLSTAPVSAGRPEKKLCSAASYPAALSAKWRGSGVVLCFVVDGDEGSIVWVVVVGDEGNVK